MLCHHRYQWIYTGLVVLSLTGCQNTLPQIQLPTTSYPKYRLTVGHFSAKSPKNTDFAAFLAQYLKKRLAQITTNTGSTASAKADLPAEITRAEIDGYIKLTYIPSPFTDNEITVNTEISFILVRHDPPEQILSTTLIRAARTPEKKDILTALQESVDEYMATIFPDKTPLTCRMARGWTDFDRLGRKMISRHNYAQALVFFRQAVDARPDDHAALYNTALVYEALGNHRQARVFLERALAMQHNPLYRKCLQLIKQQMHQQKRGNANAPAK